MRFVDPDINKKELEGRTGDGHVLPKVEHKHFKVKRTLEGKDGQDV